jgi:hypothetical protein
MDGPRTVLSIPSGTRDFHPRQVKIRDSLFNIIRSVFEAHGAVSIQTPVFEHRSILMGKYGEDEKLIYELDDHDGAGNKLALRYDHKVPLARYTAQYGISPFFQVFHDLHTNDLFPVTRVIFRTFLANRIRIDVGKDLHDLAKHLPISFKYLDNRLFFAG